MIYAKKIVLGLNRFCSGHLQNIQNTVKTHHHKTRLLKSGCPVSYNIGEIHYHKENKTNGGKQIEFSAESNQFEKIKSGDK